MIQQWEKGPAHDLEQPAVWHNPILHPFCDRLRTGGKSRKLSLVACMRKLLTILNAIVRNQKT